MMDHARELMKGAYELHVHCAPSHMSRKQDDWEYARMLDEYGMAGSITKKHFGGTADRAYIVNKYGNFHAKLYGAIALDLPVGGLNPYAVRSELLAGAKFVYLPTVHAQNHMNKMKAVLPVTGPGITILNDDGTLKQVVYDIMDVVKEFNAVLCTGHVSAEEAYVAVKAGLDYGVTMMVTHPEGGFINMSVEQQAELAAAGAFIEKCWLNVVGGKVTIDEMAERIRIIGYEHCVLVTDFGQAKNDYSLAALHQFIEALLERGFNDSEIRKMIVDNPKELLRLV